MNFVNSHRYEQAFAFTIDTTLVNAQTTNSSTYKIPLESVGFSWFVNWGDGQSDLITSPTQAEATHVYSSGGTYNITVTGNVKGLRNNAIGTDAIKITNISNWGGFNVSKGYGFADCTNLTITATDVPRFTLNTGFSGMFYKCSSLTSIPNIENWDASLSNHQLVGRTVRPLAIPSHSLAIMLILLYTPPGSQETY